MDIPEADMRIYDDGEVARLGAVERYRIAGTAPEPCFDRIAELCTQIFEMPSAAVSILEGRRQWIKARVNVEVTEIPRSISFCNDTIRSDQVLVVPDLAADPRYADNPCVTDVPHLRFYAGAPLVTAEGLRLGTLTVLDFVPRHDFCDRKRAILRSLAALVMRHIELRGADLDRAALMAFAGATDLAMIALTTSGAIGFANASAGTLFGYSPDEMIGRPVDLIIPERLRAAHAAGLAEVAAGGQSRLAGRTIEVTARRRDASELPIEMSLSVWREAKGIAMGAVIRDITARRERDARLLRLASHDTLTGLCNRHSLEESLGERFEAAGPSGVVLRSRPLRRH